MPNSERLQAEGDDSSADIYMTVDAGNLATAAEQGLFASSTRRCSTRRSQQSSATRRLVVRPQRPSADDRLSTERLAPDDIPTTYEELAEPQWKDRVCLRTSSNTYTQSLVASLIASRGYGAHSRWRTDGPTTPTSWRRTASCWTRSRRPLRRRHRNHYYLARKLAEDPDYPVGLVWANQNDRGVHVNISGAGVLANADDPELAQQLLEWLATDGQNLFVDGNNEYPVNPDIAPDLDRHRVRRDVRGRPHQRIRMGSAQRRGGPSARRGRLRVT